MDLPLIAIQTGHNSGIAVFEDRKLILILTEDKFTNVKNQDGFPFHCAKIVFKEFGIYPCQAIVCGTMLMELFTTGKAGAIQNLSISPLRKIWDAAQMWAGPRWFFRYVRNAMLDRVSKSVRANLLMEIEKQLAVPASRVSFIDHHFLHAYSPMVFYNLLSDPSPILSITMDGNGDKSSGKIYRFEGGNYTMIADTSFEGSMGYFFGEITNFLGMRAFEHEYKVMGLAGYVPDEVSEELLKKFRSLASVYGLTVQPAFNLMLVRKWMNKELLGYRFDIIAAAAQRFLEEICLKLIKNSIAHTGISRIALSGGVFMNCKLNHKIAHLPEVTKAWFMPGCGDETLVIGAGGVKFQSTTSGTVYGGQEFSLKQVIEHQPAQSNSKGEKWEYYKDIDAKIAQLLAGGHVVGRFRGRAEWGPRALGNRSILADPSKMESFFRVNDQIKCRDFWMPFAPTILESHAINYLADWDRLSIVCKESMKHMTCTAKASQLGKTHLRAAIHQKDHTLRPQILAEADNPSYHRLIKLFHRMTGIGGLLNTSMNIHGKPMVATIPQAIETFRNSGLKFMAIEDYLLSKN